MYVLIWLQPSNKYKSHNFAYVRRGRGVNEKRTGAYKGRGVRNWRFYCVRTLWMPPYLILYCASPLLSLIYLKSFFIKTNIKCVAKLRKHLPIFVKISIFSILFFVTRLAGGFCVANLRSQKYN